MDIYWIKDKQRRGPATVPDVISQLQVGELTPETLGWHKGCANWQPLKELPALADFLNKPAELPDEEPEQEEDFPSSPAPAVEAAPLPPAPQLAQEASADATTPDVTAQRIYLPSPLARLLARLVDYSLYTMLFYGALYLREVPYDAALMLSVNPLLWLPMVIIEALLLSTWGTTPGKAMMGIRLTTFGEVPRLSFLRAFWRSLMVFTLGMGLMMPQVMLLMLLLEYWMLRRRGITPWDARCSTLPTQQAPALPSRYVLAVITLYSSAVVAAGCVQPWFPRMIQKIEQNSPAVAETLRRHLPPQMLQEEKPAAPAAPAEPAPEAGNNSLPGI